METIDKLGWLLIRNREVLCVRSYGKNLFYTPGGKREKNETDNEALIREIKEELNVELDPDSIRYYNSFSAQADGKAEGVMVEINCYTAEYEGNLSPTSEIEDLAWLTIQDIDKVSLTGKLILNNLKDNNLIN